MSTSALPPARNLRPDEFGGTVAVKGFLFQHHVGAKYLIKMLSEPEILEVGFETQDDIVVLRGTNAVPQHAEFIQAKTTDKDQFWSSAMLTDSESHLDAQGKKVRKLKSSIVEKSLAHDACSERVTFRLVTIVPFVSDLDILETPLGSQRRDNGDADFRTLVARFDKVGDFVSPKGNKVEFWLLNCVCENLQGVQAVEDQNYKMLDQYLSSIGLPLFADQKASLYEFILTLAQKCASRDPNSDWDGKWIARDWFLNEITKRIRAVSLGEMTSSKSKLTEKMDKASLPPDMIANAIVTRSRYSQEKLNTTYFDTEEEGLRFEDELQNELSLLRVELDVAQSPETGAAFHARCMRKVEQFCLQRNIPSVYGNGFMYQLTGRCFHRFRPADK